VNENGWSEWRNHVLNELKENKEDHKELRESVQAINDNLIVFKTERRLLGFISTTFIAGVVSLLVAVASKFY
jgi:hypothetical protein